MMRCTGCSEVIEEKTSYIVDDRGYFRRYHPTCQPGDLEKFTLIIPQPVKQYNLKLNEENDPFKKYEPL